MPKLERRRTRSLGSIKILPFHLMTEERIHRHYHPDEEEPVTLPRFTARKMPRFDILSAPNEKVLSPKSLTLTYPFNFRTEERSIKRKEFADKIEQKLREVEKKHEKEQALKAKKKWMNINS